MVGDASVQISNIHFFVSRSRSVVDCVGVALICVV